MLISDDSYQNNIDDFNEINNSLLNAGQFNLPNNFSDEQKSDNKISPKVALCLFLVGFSYTGLLLVSFFWNIIFSFFEIEDSLFSLLIETFSYITLFSVLFYFAWKEKKYFFNELKNKSNYLMGIMFGFIALFLEIAVNSLISIFYTPELNANQTAVNSLLENYPTITFFVIVIIGPICEELTYRVGLYNLLKTKNENLGFILSGFIFAFVHISFTNTTLLAELAAFPVYLVIAYSFNYAYKKYGFAGSVSAHIIVNLASFLVTVLL